MHRHLPTSRIKSSHLSDWNLDDAEVEARRIQYGVNDIVEVSVNRWLEIARDTAKDPMIWFLIATSFLFAILKNYNQTIILVLATIPLIGMDAFLHWRTLASTRTLSSSLASSVIVIRNEKETKIPAREIVPGDLIVVPTGTPFPADGIIVAGKNLQVDESILTGEAFPVEKQIINQLPPEISEPAIENAHWGFAGTRLLTGRALLRVVYTGKETLYGEIVESALQTSQARTPLQKAIGKLVLFLIFAASIICFVLAIVRYIQGFGFIDAIMSAATLAVAALPDEFPVVFTFFLGIGVYRLAQKKALVRRAVSVENIGRITCICSDKTGTITEGRFKLLHYISAENFDDKKLLYLAMVASRIETGDPLDIAIYDAENKSILKIPQRIATFPFTEDRKRETAIVYLNSQQHLVATKGSPEMILSLCNLSREEKSAWILRINELAKSGNKVIACAQIILENTEKLNEPQMNYQFAGLLGFADPPRAEVFEAVHRCLEGNIHILMITGDHPETANAIAREIGLGNGNPKVILAQEADIYLQNNKIDFLKNVNVIARAIPSQKLGIVNALKSTGEIVAVTGDGVNDVPAIQAADIGIAMGERGTQSAREVADIVLLDDNFSSIVNAIAEGKQLFKNLKLSYKYLLMIHFPFVISAALIPLFGFPLLYYPIHIVWIELFIHPTSMLVFQNVPQSKKLEPASRQKKVHFFEVKDWVGIILAGLFSTALVVLSYIFILKTFKDAAHARSFAMGVLGITSAALSISLSNFKTGIAYIVTAATIALTILPIQIPIIANLLSLAPLTLHEWFLIFIGGVVTMLLAKV